MNGLITDRSHQRRPPVLLPLAITAVLAAAALGKP